MVPEPWTTRADWKAGRIRSSLGSTSLGCLIFAVALSVTLTPGVALLWMYADNPPPLLFKVFLLLPLAAMGPIGLPIAILGVLRARKFGEVIFAVKSMPIVPGTDLDGVIEAGFDYPPGVAARIGVTCQRSTSTSREVSKRDKDGRSRTTTETHTVTDTLWSDWWDVPAAEIDQVPGVVRIPVKRPIPPELPSAGKDPSDRRSDVQWAMTCNVALDGLDFVATFELPVFRPA